MVFSSTVFLFLFLPAVMVLYHNPLVKRLAKKHPHGIRVYRNTVLTAFSLFFYAWGEPIFVFVMLLSVLINCICGLKISKNTSAAKRKLWLVIACIFDIGIIFVFKYLSFTLKNIGLLLNTNALNIDIALPIGISFFTFQIMSYVFDVYYKTVPVQKSFGKLILYVSMFPQLIAGPIVRYETIADEIDNRIETQKDFSDGMIRFIIGLGKKALLANYVALIADNIFGGAQTGISVTTAWLGAIAYSLQIYFDFSGYSDMAIGLGKMFGFHFDENFNYPYAARSITDFWRRWHISLSTWFRDYVYIPLGGNRVNKSRWIFNLFMVWLLTGIWHGANWTFIFWGLYYFVLLLIEKQTGISEKLKGFSRIYTLLLVIIGWVVFRSDSLPMAFSYIGKMFGINSTAFSDSLFVRYISEGMVVLTFALLFSFPIVPLFRDKLFNKSKGLVKGCFSVVNAVLIIALFALCIITCVRSTYNPFIYFNF